MDETPGAPVRLPQQCAARLNENSGRYEVIETRSDNLRPAQLGEGMPLVMPLLWDDRLTVLDRAALEESPGCLRDDASQVSAHDERVGGCPERMKTIRQQEFESLCRIGSPASSGLSRRCCQFCRSEPIACWGELVLRVCELNDRSGLHSCRPWKSTCSRSSPIARSFERSLLIGD
jgi:hypothetical protein